MTRVFVCRWTAPDKRCHRLDSLDQLWDPEVDIHQQMTTDSKAISVQENANKVMK